MLAPVALFVIGFFLPTQSVNLESKKSNERFITLRDYDFVGEDQRLEASLAARMAVLRAPLNVSDIAAREAAHAHSQPDLRPGLGHPQPRRQEEPSLDLGEMFNASELGEALGGPMGGRRLWPDWKYPDKIKINYKILDMMKQNIYSAQRKIYEIQPTVVTFEKDARFRMAYIFKRLDEWKRQIRTLYYSVIKPREKHRRVMIIIWYYEHALRICADITYSIEYMLHLHTVYMNFVGDESPDA